MQHALVFDCEYLTIEGSPSRHWCGPFDPDPVVVQIGVVKIGLGSDFPLLDTFNALVVPRDREGRVVALDPFFTNLTGIEQADVDHHGLPLGKALSSLDAFSGGGKLWSWGKDELNPLAISCFVQGIAVPLPATRFGNACQLFLKAGMPYSDIQKTRSNGVAAYWGLESENLRAHNALDDARSVAFAIRHLLRLGKLVGDDLQ